MQESDERHAINGVGCVVERNLEPCNPGGSRLSGHVPASEFVLVLWKRLARTGSWAALDSLSAAAFAFAFFVLIARMLTPVQFGIAILALSAVQILQPLVDSLFHDAIVQRDKLTSQDITTATTFCIFWSIFLSLILWLISPFIALISDIPELAIFIPPLGISLLCSGASAVTAALARREMQFRQLAIRTICGRATGTAIGLWMAWAGYGVWSVIAQATITAAVSAFLLIVHAGGLPVGRIHRDRLRPFLAFALPTAGTQFLLSANTRVVTLIIGSVLGPIAAGTWNIAFRFVEPLYIVFATTVGQFTLPVFSRQQSNRTEVGRYFMLGTRLIAILFVPLFLGVALCAPDIIRLFVGEKWIDAVPIMRIVCLGTIVLLLRQVAEIALTSIGRPRYTFYTHALASALSLAGVTIGVFFGLVPAALGWALRIIAFLSVNAAFVRRELQFSWRQQFAGAVFPFVAGLLMCGVLFWLDRTMLASTGTLGRIAAISATGIVVYSLALIALDRQARLILRDLWRRSSTSL